MKLIAYIDGLNFYEASKDKHWYPAGWCNWTETIRQYCPGVDVRVKYFTTRYAGRDKARARRQRLHLLAMEEVAHAEIFYGSCRERPLKCPNCRSPLACERCDCKRRFTEKQTDVNIALEMLADAIDGAFDWACLVTADIDLLPAVHAVLRREPLSKVLVLLPPGSDFSDFGELEQQYPLRSTAEHLDLRKIRRFPDDLPKRWGMTLPPHWRADAGKRPLAFLPETAADADRPVPWYAESTGYGTVDKKREQHTTDISVRRSRRA